MKRSRTEYAILGMLAREPLSGYDLKRHFEQRVSHFWAESLGQIYPTLKKLANAGMVSSSDKTKQSGPRRIVYRITAKGRSHLRAWMAEPVTPNLVRNELLLKLFFAQEVDSEVILSHIEEFRRSQEETLEQFDHFEKTAIPEVAPSDEEGLHWVLTLRAGKCVTQARVQWCKDAIRMIKGQTKKNAKSSGKTKS